MDQQAGLASRGMQPQQGQISVEQVAKLLLQGVKPEELLAQGVPLEVIKQAIALLQEQIQQQQGQAQASQDQQDQDQSQTVQVPQEGLAHKALQ